MLTYAPEFFIPPGFRFRPTKEDILHYYLRPAINGEPLPSSVVVEADIYGENREPWKIFNKDDPKSFWVFTKLKRKSKSKIDRVAGHGCWLGRSSKVIENARGQLVGFEKYFTFSCKRDKSISQNNGNWTMHEFSLSQEGFNDYVICEIKNRDVVVDLGHLDDEVESSNNRKRKTVHVSDEDRSSSVRSMKKVCADSQSNPNMVQTSSTSYPNTDQQNFGELDHQESDHSNEAPTMISTKSPKFADDYINALEAYLDVDESDDPNKAPAMTSASSPEFANDYITAPEADLDVDGLLKGLDEFFSLKQSDLLVFNAEEISIPSSEEVCVENNQNQATSDDQGNHHPNMLLQPMINTSPVPGIQATINQSPRQQHFTDDSFYPGSEVLACEYKASIRNEQENSNPNILQAMATPSSFQLTEKRKDQMSGQPDDSFYNDLEELKCDSKALTLYDLDKYFLMDETDFHFYYEGNDGVSLDELY
ncbi:hypothetical protein PTKIN_Ptkin17bG0031000 [Pterospermum kingtungense]